MPMPPRIDQIELHPDLQRQSKIMENPNKHLRHLLSGTERLAEFSCTGANLWFDFSRQRLDAATLSILIEAAQKLRLRQRFDRMCAGDKINVTENRAVLHTATRQFDEAPVMVEGCDVLTDIKRVRNEIEVFSRQVHEETITGTTGKPFRHIVVVGIGGSYLGTEFVSSALAVHARPDINLHYLANVDSHNFGAILSAIDPSSTLWIVISKSYTTAETMANVSLIEHHLDREGLDRVHHMVTVTAKGSPGDTPDTPMLRSFHMFDFIGGRYSVTSAVGGVPLSLYLGYENFETLLLGAAEMDNHARTAPEAETSPCLRR